MDAERTGPAPARPQPTPVGVEPLLHDLPRLALMLGLWGFVAGGRRVCVVAQRVPPVVWAVRRVRQAVSGQASGRTAAACGERRP